MHDVGGCRYARALSDFPRQQIQRSRLAGRSLARQDRVTARGRTALALLPERRGYCEYNKCELSPLQLLNLDKPSNLPLPSPYDLASVFRGQRFIVFFADEVQHLYFRHQYNTLHQVCVSRTLFSVLVAHLSTSGWVTCRLIFWAARSAFALSTVSGSTAMMPMVSGRASPYQWRDLPPLSSSKHQYVHVPPITSLKDARGLANTVAPECMLDDSTLREICWFGMGSLAYMVTALADITGMRHRTYVHR